jgi:hypothetical protein
MSPRSACCRIHTCHSCAGNDIPAEPDAITVFDLGPLFFECLELIHLCVRLISNPLGRGLAGRLSTAILAGPWQLAGNVSRLPNTILRPIRPSALKTYFYRVLLPRTFLSSSSTMTPVQKHITDDNHEESCISIAFALSANDKHPWLGA